MADDARMPPTVARPTLAPALATVTDRPVGHWIAELRSPAFRGRWEIETYYGPRILWRVETDFGRKTTARRSALLTITDPAEALEALIARGVLPPSFAGDAARWFWCSRCARQGWQSAAPVACVCESGGTVPSSILDLLAWASLGGDAITRAEQLAREAATRLRPWGVRPPVETATTPDGQEVECEKPWRVVWKVTAEVRTNITGWPAGPQSVHDGEDRLAAVARWHKSRDARSRRDEMTHETLATWYETHAEFWPSGKGDARGVESPHAPVAALLRMGLALDAIDGDALVLVCPPLGGSNG